MARRDPWKHREKYERWKAETAQGIPSLSDDDSQLVRAFIEDMEVGRNIAKGTKKGGRSYIRLNTLRQRLIFLASAFRERYGTSLPELTEEQLHAFFGGMRSGEIRRLDGKRYRSTGDYVNVFKTFWHWHMRVQGKQDRIIPDICVDLDYRNEQPTWVYLTQEDVERLCQHAKFSYRILILFLYDAGIRSPSELVNVRAHDLSHDCKELRIRDETSKTFGRTIKLLLSHTLLRQYIQERRLAPDDAVFPISPPVVNRYLKRLARRVLGTGQSPGGEPYDRLTMYDFRHASACYWLPRYKSESALKYRFGWTKSNMIQYYTGFLGMRDTITADDLHLDTHKTELQQRLDKTTQEKAILEERLEQMDAQVQEILGVVQNLVRRAS